MMRRLAWSAAVTTLGSPVAIAGGFAIDPMAASSAGTAYANGAAAQDASTLWYNPAGMSLLEGGNVSAAAALVRTSFKYSDTGSTGAFALPGTGDGGDGGGFAVVPEIYAARRLDERWSVGLGVNAPFGLETEYADGWRGRYSALDSKVTSLNVNPSVAVKLDERVHVGLGVNWQQLSVLLTSDAGTAGIARLKAKDTAWGLNAGLMLQLSDAARVGIAYRSRLSYRLDGTARFSAGGGSLDSDITSRLTLPESLALQYHAQPSPQLALDASLTWVRWSRIGELAVVRTTASALGPAGSEVATVPFNWRNTLAIAIGGSYRWSGRVTLRGGIAWDPSVSSIATRDPRLPDQRRIIAGAGANVRLSGASTLDVTYVHAFFKDPAISDTVPNVPGALIGDFRAMGEALVLQYNLRL